MDLSLNVRNNYYVNKLYSPNSFMLLNGVRGAFSFRKLADRHTHSIQVVDVNQENETDIGFDEFGYVDINQLREVEASLGTLYVNRIFNVYDNGDIENPQDFNVGTERVPVVETSTSTPEIPGDGSMYMDMKVGANFTQGVSVYAVIDIRSFASREILLGVRGGNYGTNEYSQDRGRVIQYETDGTLRVVQGSSQYDLATSTSSGKRLVNINFNGEKSAIELYDSTTGKTTYKNASLLNEGANWILYAANTGNANVWYNNYWYETLIYPYYHPPEKQTAVRTNIKEYWGI